MADADMSSFRDVPAARMGIPPPMDTSIGSLSLESGQSMGAAEFGIAQRVHAVMPPRPVFVDVEDVQSELESDNDLGTQPPIANNVTLGQPLADDVVVDGLCFTIAK